MTDTIGMVPNTSQLHSAGLIAFNFNVSSEDSKLLIVCLMLPKRNPKKHSKYF